MPLAVTPAKRKNCCNGYTPHKKVGFASRPLKAGSSGMQQKDPAMRMGMT
eukprot:CAMPEP_0182512584 /NCGR_PEP_ID=MMETSP1321-20130603/32400_1 /TAXON_ID=91990 /ORGANISM="Bolidomonas sp., Strain RCC1657" /LENGTH=49 /DNA_ID= /DNA_START= /DNA_END= /DNA_ORIENTATION=